MPQPFEHRVTVRYAETDQMRVTHHGSFILYLEEARTSMMARQGCSYAALEGDGIGLPVRKLDIRYRAPAFFEDELVIRTSVTRVGPSSVTFGYEIERASDSRLIATASTELACVRLGTPVSRPIPMPDELRRLLSS